MHVKCLEDQEMQTTLRSWTLLTGAVLSAAWLASAPLANAQTQLPAEQAPNATAIPDQKLDATATALQRVTDVRRTYEEKLSSASGDEQQRIVSEANDAMSKAVTDQGISLAEFDSIIRVAQSDPDLREKILQRVRPRQ
jgi:predicted ATPase with chaperone activity